MIILDNISIQELSSASDLLLQASLILMLHRNFIPNDNPGFLENWEYITIAFEPSYRVFMNKKRNLEV